MPRTKIGEHFNLTAAMKNLFKKVMLFAAAAMAFASCENDGLTTETILPGVDVTVNATLDEATKSHFGDYNSTDNTYPTLWSGTEKWAIIVNDTKVSSSKIEFTNGNTAASTTVTFEADKAPAAINGVYTLFAVSPESQYVSVSMESDYIRYRIPGSQTPTTGSCDEKAQILIAHSEPAEALSGFDISFKHATAYGKVSFVNIAEGGNVTGVTIKSANVALAGRYVYAPSTKTISFKDEGVYEINLSTTSTTDLWFACGPAQVQGKKLTFIINTDKGKLEKEVTMPGNFEIGKVATFKVDMAGIEYPVADVVQYKKVTSLADITAGEYVIVHEVNGTCVLPNAQATSNSSVKQVTLSTKATLANDILTNVDDGVKWILTGSNTAMKVQSYVTKANYLYTTSNNNGLRVASSGSTTTWSFAALNGGFSMKDSKNSRYCGVYTAGTDWRTYTDAKQANYGANGASLTLYKKVEGGSTGGETPEVPATPVLTVNPTTLSFEAAAASKTVTCTIENEVSGVNVTATESVDWLTTSVSGKTVTITATENTTTEVRNANVTIAYQGAESKTIAVSQAAAEATEPEQPGGDATVEVFTLLGKDFGQATSYTTSVQNITSSTDGSIWPVLGFYKQSATAAAVQFGAKSSNYILTPACTNDINTIEITCTGSYTVALWDASTNKIITNMYAKPSATGSTGTGGSVKFTLPAGYKQVKIISTRTTNGSSITTSNAATYITKIVVTSN